MPTYTILLEPIQKGRWRATCPVIPELTLEGKGKRSVYKTIKGRIHDYLNSCLEHGRCLPRDKTTVKFLEVDLKQIQAEVELR